MPRQVRYARGVNADALLTRLTTVADTSPTHTLARLGVQSLLNCTLNEVIDEARAATLAHDALSAWVSSDAALPTLERQLETLIAELQAERRPLADLTDSSVKSALKELVARPVSPDRHLVLTIIDRQPMRELVRQLLTETLLDFGRRASAPVAGVARGLGSLARMAGESVKARSGGLGSLVGAVSGEVERQVEKRTVEFVEAALGGIFGKIADAISNPARAHEAAEMRLAMFEGVLELTPQQLARELINADVPGGAKVLREALQRYCASPRSHEAARHLASVVLKREGTRTLREVCADVGLEPLVERELTVFLAAQLHRVFATDAFAQWLREVTVD